MNRKMIIQYLKTIIFAILTSVTITLVICYFAFFANNTPDIEKPQYLIRGINQYITIEDEAIAFDEMVLDALKRYDAWLQVIDADGKVEQSYYVPENIPQEYSYFELVNSVLESNRISGYTLFINEIVDAPEYSVIIGCDSNLVNKHSYQVAGSENSLIIKCLIVFLAVSLCVIILAAYIFAKKVTIPISDVIEDIDYISKGQYVDNKHSNNLFENVFIQIQNLQKTLKENENTKAVWISNISHDIKTPLSTVKGYAELMTSDFEFDKKEIQTYAKEILKSEEVIEGLVEDLKISQMLVEGKLKLNKQSINLYQLIQECADASRSSMKDMDTIDIHCADSIELVCDSKLIKRSLINIICNAFVHNEEPTHVRVDVNEVEKGISITIADDGKGLKESELKHIFERYYRGTNSHLIKGTGLGLAIAKEAIIAHDGTIDVENCEVSGTQFVIFFKKTMS